MKRSTILALALLTFAVVNEGVAQVPRLISYQGVLTDNAGSPVPDGNRTIVLKIYDSPSSSIPLYTEMQTVPVARGVFNLSIGSATPIPVSLKFDRPYYLGISLENNPEFSPRTAITS